jgi:hypothetical protein
MFQIRCPAHGARVLLAADNIESLVNRRDGIELRYRCWCGHRGTWRIRHRRDTCDA